jgi:hypothetical protein
MRTLTDRRGTVCRETMDQVTGRRWPRIWGRFEMIKRCEKIRHNDQDLEDGVEVQCDNPGILECAECGDSLCDTHRIFHEGATGHTEYLAA